MADHVGIYEVVGTLAPRPTNRLAIRPTPGATPNSQTSQQSAQEVINLRVVARRTVLRFQSQSSSSIFVSGAVAGIPYTYGRGSVTQPPDFNSYVGATVITSSRDYNQSFAIGEFGPTDFEVHHYNAFFSGTEALESGSPFVPSLSGKGGLQPWSPGTRNLYYTAGKYRTFTMDPRTYLTASNESGVVRGRTFGISYDTGSSIDSAIFSRLTGNLANALSESFIDTGWYGSFYGSDPALSGTPYLPISSGVLGSAFDVVAIDAAASAELYRSTVGLQTIVPSLNDSTAYLNRQGYVASTQQRWEEAIKRIYGTGSVGL